MPTPEGFRRQPAFFAAQSCASQNHRLAVSYSDDTLPLYLRRVADHVMGRARDDGIGPYRPTFVDDQFFSYAVAAVVGLPCGVVLAMCRFPAAN